MRTLVDLQIKALANISASAAPGLPFPKPCYPDLNGAKCCPKLPTLQGQPQTGLAARTCLPGAMLRSQRCPKIRRPDPETGRVFWEQPTGRSKGFSHEGLYRTNFKWDLTQADWIAMTSWRPFLIRQDVRAFNRSLTEIFQAIAEISGTFADLPKQAIHNDANDYNILVEGELSERRRISGLIDLGDMCAAPRICDLAIAGAYVVLDHPKPERALAALVKGYHAANRLRADEVDLIWPLLRMRLAVSVVNSTLMADENPDDPYVTISQAPAWRFLENTSVNGGLMSARLRAACGLPVVDGAERIQAYLQDHRGHFADMFGQDLAKCPWARFRSKTASGPRTRSTCLWPRPRALARNTGRTCGWAITTSLA